MSRPSNDDNSPPSWARRSTRDPRDSGYDLPPQRREPSSYDAPPVRRDPAHFNGAPQHRQTSNYDERQYNSQSDFNRLPQQSNYDLPSPPGYYSSTLRGPPNSPVQRQPTYNSPLPPRALPIVIPFRGKPLDDEISTPARSYAPLRSEPATPALSSLAPSTPVPTTFLPTAQPGRSVIPPSPLSRSPQSYELRLQQHPSYPASAAGQFDDAEDLALATARLRLDASSATPPSHAALMKVRLSTTNTGATAPTETTTRTDSTAVSISPPFGGHHARSTPTTAVSTPSTNNSKGSKVVHIADHLEALPLTSFYVRPGYGTSGRKVTVESNYFTVRATDGRGKMIYHYNVEITPVVRTASQKFPRQLLRSVWEQLALEYDEKPEWAETFAAAAFDGRHNAYTPVKFPTPDDEVTTLTVAISSSREVQRQKDESSGDEFRRFRVSFKLVAHIDLEAVMRFCRADSNEKRDPKAEEACLTGVIAANLLLRDVPSKAYTQVGATGQKFYTLEGARPLPHGAVVCNGFMQSFRYSNSGYPLLNIDLGFSAFLMSGPCLEVVSQILGPGPAGIRGAPRDAAPQNPVFHSLTEMQIAILKRKLRGARFTVTHRQSARLHTVVSVTSRPASDLKFTIDGKDGEPQRSISIAQFYHEYYGCRVQYPGLPCIQYGKRAYVPLEFVNIADFNSLPPTNLSPHQIAEMIKHSAVRPPERRNMIMTWRQRLAHETQPKIATWGLQVNRVMVQVDARVLPTPEVKYERRSIKPRDGSWNLRGLRFIRDGNRPLKNWAIVSFDRYTDTDSMARWVTFLAARLSQLGIDVVNRQPVLIAPIDPRVPGKITEQLQLAAREAFKISQETPQLICCILPGKDAWLYEQIKRIAFTELKAPLATQCMQAAKIKNTRGLEAYTDNLCMKIAQKLGGLSHRVSLQDLPGMVYGKTMILGADLGHPPFRPDSQEPTVACSIATYNPECDAYSAQIRLQEGRSEIINDLSSMVEEHLRIFAKENHDEYPERILVFRDGISEGQYAAATQYETHAIVTACNRIQTGYRPRILVCVCARRHNTRFFAKSPGDADRSGNLPAGLVVDKTVTHPYAFDFFLQAHAGLVGTARPTHYICLLDELGITPDQLQQLCNALSYSFARCTKAVSLVPVCYMADLVCQKARLIVQSNEGTVAPSEFSGSRARSRFGPAAPSTIGTEATAARRQRFDEKHDILHIQKILAKNAELSRVAWWM